MNDPLHYVLMFPYGTLGWTRTARNRRITLMDYAAFHVATRCKRYRSLHAAAMFPATFFPPFIVDLWARVEQQRLQWLRHSQKTIRMISYRIGTVSAGSCLYAHV